MDAGLTCCQSKVMPEVHHAEDGTGEWVSHACKASNAGTSAAKMLTQDMVADGGTVVCR